MKVIIQNQQKSNTITLDEIIKNLDDPDYTGIVTYITNDEKSVAVLTKKLPLALSTENYTSEYGFVEINAINRNIPWHSVSPSYQEAIAKCLSCGEYGKLLVFDSIQEFGRYISEL